MTARQRQEQILSEVLERKHVSAKDLAVQMSVSEATVRRDLKALADTGRVDLVHGGAMLPRTADTSFLAKGQVNIEAKKTIGRLAAELVGDGEQIFLDSGTTCLAMAAFLKRRRGLSVIINSVRMAAELDVPGLSVIMLGGQFRPDRMDTVGTLAASSLDQLRGYAAFVGADGLGMDFGPTANDIESASLYRLAVRNAREATLLVDHSKFASPSLYKIVDWESILRIVTDRPPDPGWRRFLEARRIRVVCPDPDNSKDGQAAPPANPGGATA